ncbi:MAG: Zn-ribbon domain-containing protein [Methanogenium sp.]|nr:Zn-ribbon domain-containing protein [Methanogenium sp.]
MAHKCTKCGREFADGSIKILKGCPSCGGNKFLYIRNTDLHKDVLEEKSVETIAAETKEEIMEIKPEIHSEVDIYDRIESIRVLNPGSYELNIEKLAESDELVVRVGNEEQYIVDILSMSKSKKKRKPNDK